MAERGTKRKDLGPPPRWLRCPRKGAMIVDKFLPFKTPLDDSYDGQVPPEYSFTPQMMVNSLNSYKVKMGMWVDLTNTTRFYDRKIVEGLGIKYVKLECKGHSACPTPDQTKTFIELCQRYISVNPLQIIGVHCTHGFNRTGFLIVSYLVESLSWSVEAAVSHFAQARPPGIYKADYLRELFKRYGDVDDTPEPPPLPDWCNEDDDGSIDDDGLPVTENEKSSKVGRSGVGGSRPHKRRREFVRKNPVFMEGVPGVVAVTDPAVISTIQRRCQTMCGWKSSGFPGSQPVSMDVENIKMLTEMPYKVSWKADGTRYMLLIDGPNEVYFIDRDNCVFHVPNMVFPRRKAQDEHIFGTLLDGEMIIDKVNDVDVPRYLAYDIITFENIEVGKTDFERRLLCINKEIVGPRRKAMEENRIDRSQQPFSIRAKDFWDITTSSRLLGEKFRKEVSHDIDGLIFQPVQSKYSPGRCPEVLKWKPPELNSVDFRLEIKKIGGEGIVPTTVGCLYVGGLDQPFGEIKVTKELKLLDKKIVECRFDSSSGRWSFLRERTDKSFPNSLTTAMGVCNSIKHPVTTERLFYVINHERWCPKPRFTS